MPESFFPQMRTYASGQQECVRLVWLIRELAMNNSALIDSFAPEASFTEKTNNGFRQLRLAFGDSTRCSDGRLRSGILNILAEPDWPAEGSYASIFLQAYTVTSVKGNTSRLHADSWEVHSLPLANDVFPMLEHRPRGFQWQTEVATATWVDTFRQVMILGFDTPELTDDLWILDEKTKVNLNAESYDLRFAPPLIVRPSCDYITSGKATFQSESTETITLDFGLDECDNMASMQLGENDQVTLDLLN
jgi:hypothetical protein